MKKKEKQLRAYQQLSSAPGPQPAEPTPGSATPPAPSWIWLGHEPLSTYLIEFLPSNREITKIFHHEHVRKVISRERELSPKICTKLTLLFHFVDFFLHIFSHLFWWYWKPVCHFLHLGFNSPLLSDVTVFFYAFDEIFLSFISM